MAAISKYYVDIKTFVLAGSLLDATVRALRREGEFKVESIVFWTGSARGTVATVSGLLVPQGNGVSKHPLQVRVDERTMAALCTKVDPPERVLLGQVHTHMGKAFHSWADDNFSLGTPGFISIVIPDFARGGVDTWQDWAFFVCRGEGKFDPLDRETVARSFRIDPSVGLETHDIRPSSS